MIFINKILYWVFMDKVMALTLAAVFSFSFIQTLDAQETSMGFQVSAVNPKSNEPLEQKSLKILQTPSEIILKTHSPNGQPPIALDTPVSANDFRWGVKVGKRLINRIGVQTLAPMAENGHAGAQFELATLYYNGWGVSQNYKLAAEWYRKAAAQGYDNSQHVLGNLYDKGEGVPQDKTEASNWWRKAAEQGHIVAQITLAERYSEPSGGLENYEEAAKWYKSAAKNGSSIAQFKLAEMYELSRGLPQDNAMAHMWYNIASATDERPDYRELAIRERDRVGKNMIPVDLMDAQQMATQCMSSGYKNCRR